ncbi:winged helix-turn-helix domain-containing protein [Isoptericola jiangsuensis]|uniref:winged helix-turn-helix domain-containing protein n=1 Tax=Isoptericola jiangsuensis TaxID=548579 RepID=UPI003AAC24BC
MPLVVLVDPQLEPGDALPARLREHGVALEVFTDPLRALAHIASQRPDVVVLAARLGATLAAQLTEVVHEEFGLPVLLADDSADVDLIGPAVLVGARPLVRIPYDPVGITDALRQVQVTRRRPEEVRVGPLELVPAGYDAHLHGRGIDLSVLEFEVLLELAVHHDHVVARVVLLQMWPESADPEEKLVGIISRLRRRLAPFGVSGAIHTVRGLGYRLDSHVLASGRPGRKLAEQVVHA